MSLEFINTLHCTARTNKHTKKASSEDEVLKSTLTLPAPAVEGTDQSGALHRQLKHAMYRHWSWERGRLRNYHATEELIHW